MTDTTPTLHLLCGKIASGKSTLAARLADQAQTVLIAEDDWLGTLYAGQMTSIPDYVRCSASLRQVMGPHVASLLSAGVSVVLDFPANTRETRQWMRGILERTEAAHVLHVLDVSDEACMARMIARNEQGDHPFAVTEAQFRQISKHYAAPTAEEGFTIKLHTDHA
ncbi:ATP-binding protein [Rhodobacteraceae bacterium NNCM2]|nr:ATP-binding protein [Coraliihabitans acroporae]